MSYTCNDEEKQTHFEFLKIDFLLCLRQVLLLVSQQFDPLSEWLVNVENWEADQDQVRKEEDQDLQLEIEEVRRGHIVGSVAALYLSVWKEATILANVGVTCIMTILTINWRLILNYFGDEEHQKGHALGIQETPKFG